MKFHKASNSQSQAAKRFSEEFGISVSQCMKYLDECFAFERGDITKEEFEETTGHEIPES